MTDWTAAYKRLYKFLDNYTGSQFIKAVQQTDPDLLDYMDYIEKRRKEEKSTTKKDYFKDILLSYSDDIKLHLFEQFLSDYERSSPNEAKEIRTILNGGKVDIAKAIYAKAVASKEIDEILIGDTLKGLEAYPEAHKLYKQALTGFNSGTDERHILDDLRLSVEYFLRSILKNEKTLENQISLLGQFQKEKGISSEISNTFLKLIDLFGKYQNTYVKHHDKVKHSEIEFIFNLTNTFYRFLLSH
jgi:tetratricopeptide (TPR) repeat protein